MADRGKPRKGQKGAEKTPSNSSTVALVVPKHGRGLLQQGNPGNAGGGRKPDAIRNLALQIGEDKALPRLREILDDKESTPQAIVSAARAVLDMVPKQTEIVHRTEGDWRVFLDACDEELVVLLGSGVDVPAFEQRVLARYAKKKGVSG